MMGLRPSEVTLVTAISASSDIAALLQGRELHGFSWRHRFALNDKVKTSLVDMYAKCGRVKVARDLLEQLKEKRVVSWNVMDDYWATIDKQQSVPLTIENRDMEIRCVLAAEDKLHPALFSAEAEHKCLMDGLISFAFKHEDLQFSFFRSSATGVELVQLRNDQSRATAATAATDLSKDPLLSIDTQSTRSWGSLPLNSQISFERGIQRHHSGGEWCDMLDLISDRKTQALAPENFENMWTKGRNYKRKEGENLVFEQGLQHSVGKSDTAVCSKATSKPREKHMTSFQEDDEHNLTCVEEVETGSSSSYTSEEEETGHVLDSPGTKVWDGRSNRNLTVSHIHHPLENPDKHILRKSGRRQLQYQKNIAVILRWIEF
ncbi:hypothetical protein Q3G72_032931 [Acer saccharum]|nr:hypothetical protein Q3G72_032931 [Acer saccharum]